MHDYQMLLNFNNQEEKVMHGHVNYHQMILHRFTIIYEKQFFWSKQTKIICSNYRYYNISNDCMQRMIQCPKIINVLKIVFLRQIKLTSLNQFSCSKSFPFVNVSIFKSPQIASCHIDRG